MSDESRSEMETSDPRERDEAHQDSSLDRLSVLFGMFVWLGGVHLTWFLLMASALTLSWKVFLTCFSFLVSLLFVPLWDDGEWKDKVSTFLVRCAIAYFPITLEQEVQLEDEECYIVAFYPHSVLPIGISALHPNSPICPTNFRHGRIVGCGSSAIHWCPFVRHVWSWLSIESCSRSHVSQRLSEGMSVILVPGGVRECMLLQKDSENIFLNKRRGFIKLALQHGASIVPAFAFGQSSAYNYARLGPPVVSRRFVDAFARTIGFLPMYIWGSHGSPLPRPVPIHVVLGKPIKVEEKIASPSKAQLDKLHAQYVDELTALFQRHVSKGPCTKPNLIIH